MIDVLAVDGGEWSPHQISPTAATAAMAIPNVAPSMAILLRWCRRAAPTARHRANR